MRQTNRDVSYDLLQGGSGVSVRRESTWASERRRHRKIPALLGGGVAVFRSNIGRLHMTQDVTW